MCSHFVTHALVVLEFAAAASEAADEKDFPLMTRQELEDEIKKYTDEGG